MFWSGKGRPLGIGDLLMAVLRNVLVADDLEGVGAFDTLSYFGGVGTNTLTEATKFVRV